MRRLLPLLVALLGACTPTDAESPSGAVCMLEVGKPACEIEGEHLLGTEPATLASARGQVVLVDFWATTCLPCKRSFPQYQDLADSYPGKLGVIAVSTDSPEVVEAEEVKRFATALDVDFAIVWDRDGITARLYNPPALPTAYLVDKEGILRHVHAGFKGGSADEIRAQAEALID